MEKQTLITFVLLVLGAVSIILHNLLSVMLDKEEAISFFFGIILMSLFILSVFYNIWTLSRSGRPKDIWKLGYIAFLGLLGIIPNFNFGFFGFLGFLGFFTFKNQIKKERKS